MSLAAETVWTIILFAWVVFVTHPVTKTLYNYMRRKGLSHIRAVYYNRKIIHILAGGLPLFLVPYLYSTPLLPAVAAEVLAVAVYLPHCTGKLMYWFQTKDNINEVHFCVMWGAVVALGWLLGNWWYGVLPAAFMAFGDGVTGIVRNALYNRRTKSWIGNAAMAAVTIPLGYVALGSVGAVAGLVASIAEHFEYKKIDDNIVVPLVSFLTILIGSSL